jgi:hypothetical protein
VYNNNLNITFHLRLGLASTRFRRSLAKNILQVFHYKQRTLRGLLGQGKRQDDVILQKAEAPEQVFCFVLGRCEDCGGVSDGMDLYVVVKRKEMKIKNISNDLKRQLEWQKRFHARKNISPPGTSAV